WYAVRRRVMLPNCPPLSRNPPARMPSRHPRVGVRAMRRSFAGMIVLAVGLCAVAQEPPVARQGRAPAGPWQGEGKTGAVACGGLPACEAGMEILKAGGNAMDAAAATVFALSITDSTLFCFGGEVPFVVYDAKRGVVEVVCGQGTAPKLATL